MPYYQIPSENGRDGYDIAMDAADKFYRDNKKKDYWMELENFRREQKNAEEAMRAYQNAGKRYRQ